MSAVWNPTLEHIVNLLTNEKRNDVNEWQNERNMSLWQPRLTEEGQEGWPVARTLVVNWFRDLTIRWYGRCILSGLRHQLLETVNHISFSYVALCDSHWQNTRANLRLLNANGNHLLVHKSRPSISVSQPAEDYQNQHKLVSIKGLWKQCEDFSHLHLLISGFAGIRSWQGNKTGSELSRIFISISKRKHDDELPLFWLLFFTLL